LLLQPYFLPHFEVLLSSHADVRAAPHSNEAIRAATKDLRPLLTDFCCAAMFREMSTGRKIGFALLGLVLGGVVGCGLGLLGGLAYTELTSTSGFEGYSGFVVAYWMLCGIVLGLIAGLVAGLKWSHR
jgi:hypothetical protein